ncbi:transglycosylase SLT domain-containing protein [Halorhodospira halochloris]|uniref:Transglycosylase SLT domain-containing protein n=1 Tax=Halorhodospira halochloris TaxID=1052 RepID=A0A0X8XA68_HALHR|nr:transglycosylase SLT domain-containing protein [Halorhodospira halochloris]MBK1652006.1 hypothetical protein [Halorhodospira halochloris]MCG5530890.1 transglycosylase SLT domain-containing protein [Halorhodospira halochloris]MCG5547896.1 transglycosylase SLT domain-containing protein [Halorhodospira halochloris]BAU58304.1 hypothetical protein HH1059_15930 [Halorhodospira halochloris]
MIYKNRFICSDTLKLYAIFFFVSGVMLGSSSVTAQHFRFNDHEEQLMRQAYELGKPHDLGMAMMGVLVQETRMGRFGPVGDRRHGFGKRSYGVMQLKLHTAKDVISFICPELDEGLSTDEEIIAKLLYDHHWNMQVAACYLAHLQNQGLSWRETLIAYNEGLRGSRRFGYGHPYAQSIADHVSEGKVRFFYDNFIAQ